MSSSGGSHFRPWRRLAWLTLASIALLGALASADNLERLERVRRQDATTLPAPSETGNESDEAVSEKPKIPIPPLNFTLVDELFAATLDEKEVVQKWRGMDKQLLEGVRAILKIIFPKIVDMSSDARVSGNCSGAIFKWIISLRNMRSWAVKMLDATGKPGAGILEGSLSLLGNARQCMSIRAPDEDEIEVVGEFREYFRGQHCVLQLRPHLPAKRPFYSLNSTLPSLLRSSYRYYERNAYDDLAELALAFNFVHIRADLCVPSSCSRDDIQRVADFLSKKVEMRARVSRCEQEPREDERRLDDSQLAWLAVWLVFLGLVVLSTVYSLGRGKSSAESSPKASRFLHSLLKSMSLNGSLAQMRHIDLDRINNRKPLFLYSLRLIVLLWIFLVSLVSQMEFQYLREMVHLRDMIMHWPMQIIVNSSLQFDTLILLTAFTYSYQNINSNMTDLVKYNVAKYSRLMPSVMLLVAVTILTPLIYTSRSPIWHDIVDGPAQVCKTHGLVNIFFLQNFLNYNQICLPQTWLFCVELQLSLLAIPLVHLLNKNFDQGHGKFRVLSIPVLTLLGVVLAGCIINFVNVYMNALPPAWFLTFPDKDDKNYYFTQQLCRTTAHLSAYALGLLAGHLCRCQSISSFSGRPYGRRCCHALMSIASLVTMTALIFGTHSWSIQGVVSPLASALYAALAPLVWALAWCLLLFRLTVPSWVDKCGSELPHPWLFPSGCAALLVRLGRLSFLAYLINPWVNTLVFAVQEQTIFSSTLMIAHTFIGNIVFTFALAFLVSALVELPARRLVKKILLGSRRHCTNFSIITRQMDIQQRSERAHGAAQDSFQANAAPARRQGAEALELNRNSR